MSYILLPAKIFKNNKLTTNPLNKFRTKLEKPTCYLLKKKVKIRIFQCSCSFVVCMNAARNLESVNELMPLFMV